MRNMSFAYTTEQARGKTKTVTRRQSWWNLKPGELIQQIVKGQGLKKGEKVEKIHVIRIFSTGPELIEDITEEDVRKEGFENLTPEEFILFYCIANKVTRHDECNRIEFEYEDG